MDRYNSPNRPDPAGRDRETTMFATLKNLIPEPRQAEHPRRYIGRHRQPDAIMDVEPETVDAAEPEATLEEPVAVGPDRQIA